MTTLTSLPIIKQYLGAAVAATTQDDTLISSFIPQASAAIENACNRHFVKTTNITRSYAQWYQRQTSTLLYVDDDLLAVSSLTNGDGTAIPSTGYWLEERNDPPYTRIRLKSNYVWVFNTDGEIQVTGDWGYANTVPDDIVQACNRLVVWMYRQKDTAADIDRPMLTNDGVTLMPSSLPKDVLQLIRPYRRLLA